MKRKEKENYLDYIPSHNPGLCFEKKENGRIEVEVINRGFCNRVAQLLFHKPKKSYIELDEIGSFVWEQMDGKRTIYDICMRLKARFGNDAEPLFDRSVNFFRILKRNSFIVYGK